MKFSDEKAEFLAVSGVPGTINYEAYTHQSNLMSSYEKMVRETHGACTLSVVLFGKYLMITDTCEEQEFVVVVLYVLCSGRSRDMN